MINKSLASIHTHMMRLKSHNAVYQETVFSLLVWCNAALIIQESRFLIRRLMFRYPGLRVMCRQSSDSEDIRVSGSGAELTISVKTGKRA